MLAHLINYLATSWPFFNSTTCFFLALDPAACGIIWAALLQSTGRGFEETLLRLYEYTFGLLEKNSPSGVGLEQVDSILELIT